MSRILLVLALVVAFAIILATSAALPTTVATHFALGGRADGFMTRIGYQVFYCSLLAFMSLVTYGGLAWLPARFPHLVNLPNRDYWLDRARAETTLATLRGFGVALALLIVTLLVAMHLIVVEANTRTPPTLHETAFLTALGVFIALLLGLLVSLYARFRAPR
jgi:hypothetical protein